MTSEDAIATAAASIKLVVTEVDWTPLTLFLPVISVIFNSAESISRFFASFEVEGCWSIAVVDPLCSTDKLDTTETFDPLVDWLALAEALTDSFGEVVTVLSTVWLFSACLSASLPWAWFLSAITPAARLLLVVTTWLLSWVPLDKASPSLLVARLSAGAVLTSRDAEVEVETEVWTSDSLTELVLSARDAEVWTLTEGAGWALADADSETGVEADACTLADCDGVSLTEADSEAGLTADWLVVTELLADALADRLADTETLVEREALTDWLTDSETDTESCSACSFTSACAWAMIELLLASVVASAWGSVAMTALPVSLYSDVSSAYTVCSWVTTKPAAPAAKMAPIPASVLAFKWAWSSSSVSDRLVETTSPIPPIRKRSSWEFEAFTQFFPDL